MRFIFGFFMGALVGAKYSAFVLHYIDLGLQWLYQYMLTSPPPTPPV